MEVVRRLPALLLLLLLGGRASAQAPPRVQTDERWLSAFRAWEVADEPLLRAAIGRLVWERAATDPLERQRCAALADAPGASPVVRDLLRRLADPPPLALAPPGSPDDEPREALLAGGDLLDEARRVLGLVALVDGAGEGAGPRSPGERLLARLASSTDPMALALRRTAATRAALVELRLLADLQPPGSALGGAELDEALDLLAARARGDQAPVGLARFERDVRACTLAALAEPAGRPWLGHALLAPLAPDLAARAISMAATARLRDAVGAWRAGASAVETLDRLAPVLRAPHQRAAQALDAALRRNASFPRVSPPTLEAWEGSGQEERLAALDAALCDGTPLDAPFPPDAPMDERGERPTLGLQLEAAGWAAIPLLLSRADEAALLRADGEGPLGLGQVSDLALEALRPWGAPTARRLVERRAALDAWWAPRRERGPLSCWHEALRVSGRSWAQLPPGGPLRLARMLGDAAAPIVSATLAGLPPDAAEVDRAAWLDAAIELRDEAFLPELAAAARSGRRELTLVGARGLAALGDEADRAEAAWLARVAIDDPLLTGEGLALLRRLDPPAAQRLLRDAPGAQVPGAQSRPRLVRFLRRDLPGIGSGAGGAATDARLALLRLVALRRGRFSAGPAQALTDDVEAWLAEDGPAVLAELGATPHRADRGGDVAAATSALLLAAPAWSADPARRVHAVVTALLLGPDALERAATLPGVDPRALVAGALRDPDPAVARRLRAGLGPHAAEVEAWLRTWLEDPAAVARLEGPVPAALLVGDVVVESGLAPALAEKARTLGRVEVTAADLQALVLTWLDAADGPALRLRLVRPAWGAWRLELAPGVAGERTGLSVVARVAGVSPASRAADGLPGPALLDGLLAQGQGAAGPAELQVVATR